MQRLFSNFAGGWAGFGLLLQRAATGGIAIYLLLWRLLAHPPVAIHATEILISISGTFLLIGLYTPSAGVVLAVTALWMIVFGSGDRCVPILLATLGCTLALIGPGAWSADARLFGRRRIRCGAP